MITVGAVWLGGRVPLPLRWAAAVAATGVVAGLAGAALMGVLRLVQHLAYGLFDHGFGAAVVAADPARRVAAMAAGGLAVGLGWWALQRWTSPVREAEDVVGGPLGGRMRLRSTAADAVLQVVAVGAGASLGREGAPRQVGAAAGGWLAARCGLEAQAQRVLLACGAGAGLAAVYDVPLGGALFTLEVLLTTLAPVAVLSAVATSVIAAMVAWPFVGMGHVFTVSHLTSPTASLVVAAVVVGPLAAGVGLAFRALAGWARRLAPRGWRLPVATTLAFAVVGLVAVPLPQVLGNGRAPAELAFVGQLGLVTAVLLLVARPLATALCLGSGARGGLLTPAVALGALLGLLGAAAWSQLWPGAPASALAVVGAAAVLSVTQRAPLTATVLLLEFTGSATTLLVPVLAAVTTATATARLVGSRPSPTPP
ncbi:H+/Cl- antiporter ClcA [Quadrisphaera granulorum]|uniref:H+/Cl-antiporter ClcA n=1 Tax=Quadrisphaera granulorum TaxID=317664 RepID=A0A316ATN9_9ACTN|nr:chloride channel protein [Quadrisphaera granulorum]PWJ53547.1 H+/Cl- antiporter ClcA [Quadrisphaera granulorum]SZE96889.1 H+/Cl- antiporter ClcA [Quadrisphaera granulorum]